MPRQRRRSHQGEAARHPADSRVRHSMDYAFKFKQSALHALVLFSCSMQAPLHPPLPINAYCTPRVRLPDAGHMLRLSQTHLTAPQPPPICRPKLAPLDRLRLRTSALMGLRHGRWAGEWRMGICPHIIITTHRYRPDLGGWEFWVCSKSIYADPGEPAPLPLFARPGDLQPKLSSLKCWMAPSLSVPEWSRAALQAHVL
jgi:hypothetical protein